MSMLFTLVALFAAFQILNKWLKDHPAVPDSPASLMNS